jgi:methionine-rich copper-binding protein CopC
VAAVVTLVVAALPAGAHTRLRSTNPTDGQHVPQTPREVVLTFTEPVLDMGTRVMVTGPSGPVHQGPARSVGGTVTQALQSGAPAGNYTVDWRITSADGHPISGAFIFTSDGAGGGTTASRPAPAPTAPSPSGSSMVPWLLALAAAAVVGLLALRRRSAELGSTSSQRTHPDDEPDDRW